MKPRLLDLFCGGGGASMGYHRAGFDVVGVDWAPQPNYPFKIYQQDALEFDLAGFDRIDAIHASPPCQTYSAMTACRPGLADDYEALIEPVRERLAASGLPYVIENVVGAPLASGSDLFGAHGVELCGGMFGLDLYRHRLFETSFPVVQPPHPAHVVPASRAGHWQPGTTISVSGNCAPIAVARAAMGIDWMSRDELGEAIPPAYTEWLGARLLVALDSVEVAMRVPGSDKANDG
jgi:DNA (cytosine-5)-methyltransferase 1